MLAAKSAIRLDSRKLPSKPAVPQIRMPRGYVKASKKDKGLILDQMMSVTGWSQANARRQLAEAAKRPPGTGPSVPDWALTYRN